MSRKIQLLLAAIALSGVWCSTGYAQNPLADPGKPSVIQKEVKEDTAYLIGQYTSNKAETVYETPDKESEIVDTIKKEKRIRIVKTEGDWGYTSTGEGTGYVPMDDLALVDEGVYYLGTYAFTKDTPIMSSTESTAEKIGTIKKGDEITVEKISDTYYAVVRPEEEIGYVSLLMTDCVSEGVEEEEAVWTPNSSDIIGHGGFSAQATFNSARAYQICGQNGSYGAEGDLYMTKDGKLYMYHEGAGQNKKKLCYFADYLSICKDYNMVAVIDMKWTGSRTKMAERAYDIVHDMDMDEQVIWQGPKSMKSALQTVRKLDPDANMWYLVSGNITSGDIKEALNLGCSGINTNALTAKEAAKVHDSGLKVCFYQTDSPSLQERLRDKGCDFIMANGK